jgi:ribosomal protein L37AE/L43A
VSRISRMFGRLRRRVVIAYALACVRKHMRRHRLRVPSGVWFCEHCSLVLWHLDTFVVHGRLHAA